MTEEIAAKKPVESPKRAEDLSREIEKSIDRLPDESVRTVRLFDDCYRCNWWVADKKASPIWLVTGTIRRSRFLRATKTSAGLVIDNLNMAAI